MNSSDKFLPGQLEALEKFSIESTFLTILRKEKELGMTEHSELYFLLDGPNPYGWIKKAIITAEYHGIQMDTNIMDFFVTLKRTMKEDRKAGLILW